MQVRRRPEARGQQLEQAVGVLGVDPVARAGQQVHRVPGALDPPLVVAGPTVLGARGPDERDVDPGRRALQEIPQALLLVRVVHRRDAVEVDGPPEARLVALGEWGEVCRGPASDADGKAGLGQRSLELVARRQWSW